MKGVLFCLFIQNKTVKSLVAGIKVVQAHMILSHTNSNNVVSGVAQPYDHKIFYNLTLLEQDWHCLPPFQRVRLEQCKKIKTFNSCFFYLLICRVADSKEFAFLLMSSEEAKTEITFVLLAI